MKRRREVFNRRQGIPDLMGNIAKYVVIAVLILFFISETKRMYALGYSIFSPKARDRAGEGITASVTITSDMSDAAIARLLADEDLIESSLVFRVQLKFSEYDGKLTAGTYELSSEMLPEEMMERMSASNAESDGG
ncbi:endolytic transglycosylase MltG [Lachnoclostridium sp. Marseille-P6806]|uniref:endolytic transglycosylase MltG n=1 Tax=Lachnoclostridium sp. Marseille-P6806 TaxID=2364793 RepID=UPI0010307025|nr:endolytic transglycosylase MltG [Lachnoclostridium sp. Marseille-P6806]